MSTEYRTGIGYDVHAVVEGRRLMLGGVEIPWDRGLLGHSDADVLLHAIIDALLGSVAQGDIGKHFPDTDPAWKDADSRELLRGALVRAEGAGMQRIVNVDATVIAQRPKLADHMDAIRSAVASTLAIELERVSVKATTHEQLGSLGRGEGIAAMATVSVEWEQR